MTTYAIVVGINVYPDETGQPELHGAVADACDFADWALDQNGGAINDANLFFWPHPWPTAEEASQEVLDFLAAPTMFEGPFGPVAPTAARAPIAAEVFKTALNLAQQLIDTGADPAQQRIYIFFAGHGVRTYEVGGAPQTFFVARDFSSVDVQYAEGLVGCETLRRSLLKRGFGEVFMFLDCCRVQDPVLPVPALPLCYTTDEPPTLPWGVGNAAQDGMEAFEVDEPQPRGAFSLALVEGLRNHRNAITRGLTICELRDYVKGNIATKEKQKPDFKFNPTEEPFPAIFPALFAPPPPGSIVLDLSGLPPGTRVQLTDGALNPVPGWTNIPAGPAPVVIPNRPPGIYKVQRLGDGHEPQLFEHPGSGTVYVH